MSDQKLILVLNLFSLQRQESGKNTLTHANQMYLSTVKLIMCITKTILVFCKSIYAY